MTIKRLNPGEPFPTSATFWNPLIDKANNAGEQSTGGGPQNHSQNQTVLTVKNTGAVNIDQAAPIMLKGTSILDQAETTWTIAPSLNPDILKRPAINARDEIGIQRMHAVTLEPIKAGQFGRAVISGAVPCKVWTDTETSPTHAEPATDGTTYQQKMVGAFCGFPILAREKGTGDKMALVLMGHRTPARIRVFFPMGYNGGNQFPFYASGNWTGYQHTFAYYWKSSGAIITTNAPHIFENKTDGLYWKNRDIRYFKACARFRVALNSNSMSKSTTQKIAESGTITARVYMTLNNEYYLYQTDDTPGNPQIALGRVLVTYPEAQHGSLNIATSGNSSIIAEAEHSMLFAAYRSFNGPGGKLTITGQFQSDLVGDGQTKASQIRDCLIEIEEIPDALALKNLATTPNSGGTNILGTAEQSKATSTPSTGTGTGTVTAEEPT